MNHNALPPQSPYGVTMSKYYQNAANILHFHASNDGQNNRNDYLDTTTKFNLIHIPW